MMRLNHQFRPTLRSLDGWRASRERTARRGLAPLELTLVLPFLVLMMCLMINFGVVGAWKIRTQANARYAAWRTVNARTGEYNPTPIYWPKTAPLTTGSGTDLPNVSQLWDSQQDLLCPCIRGPMLTAPAAERPVVVKGRLEMDGFVLEGNATLSQSMPVAQNVFPNRSRYTFHLKQDVFDNQWQFYSLNIPFNSTIRANVWWNVEHSDLSSLDPLINQNYQLLTTNLQRLQSSPKKADLYPLDNDDEFIRYYGWPPPDFYPRLMGMCEADPRVVYAKAVAADTKGSLIFRINGLPKSMSQSFLAMYRKWVCELEMCGFPETGIDPLRQRRDDLTQFVTGSMVTQNKRCECPPLATCACPPSPVGVGH